MGIERSWRFKEAGIRTHFVVAVGSALLMVVSLQFEEQSRIAAQIVSGIGFLGAGMIFFRRESLHGLTTAAGIWATAGIGMSAGAGLYCISIYATLFIFFVQWLLHSPKFSKKNQYHLLHVVFDYTSKTVLYLKRELEVDKFSRFKAVDNGDKVRATAVIRTKRECLTDELVEIIANNKNIHSIERLEDL